MMICGELILIAFTVVFITDLTDFPSSVKKFIWRAVKGQGKPYKDFSLKLLECSLCQTWWLTLLWTLLAGEMSIGMVFFCAFLAYMTPIMRETWELVFDFAVSIIRGIRHMTGIE